MSWSQAAKDNALSLLQKKRSEMTIVKITAKELHIHFHGVDDVLDKLAVIETNLKEYIMATKQEVLDAIAEEGNEVAEKIDELKTQIDELISAGGGATPEDLEEIKLAVQAIFTPVVEPPGEAA